VTSSVAVFEAATWPTWVKSMYRPMTKSWLKTRKKEKIWKSQKFLH